MALQPLKPLQRLQPLKPLVGGPSSLGEPEGNAEQAALTDHQKMMKQLREQQQAAIDTANETGYWFAVYFQSNQQRAEFIEALQLNTGGQYVDGLELAQKLNIPLTERTIPYKVGTLDRKCAALAR